MMTTWILVTIQEFENCYLQKCNVCLQDIKSILFSDLYECGSRRRGEEGFHGFIRQLIGYNE